MASSPSFHDIKQVSLAGGVQPRWRGDGREVTEDGLKFLVLGSIRMSRDEILAMIQQALDELEAEGILRKTGEFRMSVYKKGQLSPVYVPTDLRRKPKNLAFATCLCKRNAK